MKIARISALGLVPLATFVFWTGCSASNTPDGADAGTGGSGSDGIGLDDDGITPDGGGGGGSGYIAEEWSAEPVIDDGAPANAASLFDGAAVGTGPCVREPQNGSMVPKNWLRPRFNLAAAGGETLFEIKLSSEAAEGKTLTVYTTNAAYAMKGGFFAWIANKATQAPVKVNVAIRATTATGGAVSSSATSFVVAPVTAGGSMVYWASKASGDVPANSRLEGFRIGDEATITALVPGDVQESGIRREDYSVKDDRGSGAGKVSCIGCHTSTPDGTAAVFNDGFPWSAVAVSIEESSKGQRAGGVTDLGARLLQMPFIGTTTFSPAFWGSSKIAVSTLTTGDYYGAGRNVTTAADLIWVNVGIEGDGNLGADGASANARIAELLGTGWGKIARTGDTGAVANPAWSPDGTTIAYASVTQVAGSHVGGLVVPGDCGGRDCPTTGSTESNIYTVPYAAGAGGTATPVPGASVAGAAEYYPDYSSDGKFIAFNRDASTIGYIYYRPNAEINVIPAAGGTAHRLVANDPPACTGEASPGVINSWAKWSPNSEIAGGVTYYWVVFSSARQYNEKFNLTPDQYTPANLDTRSSQLYLAAVAVAADGTITSYPAAYIWNQSKDTSNLTPAWDEFKIPEVPVR